MTGERLKARILEDQRTEIQIGASVRNKMTSLVRLVLEQVS